MKNRFTKKDLKDGDIVTYRIGWKRTVKGKELVDENGTPGMYLSHFTNGLTLDDDHDLDIVKVERRTKTEVIYERKEILDEAEKRYLREVIRPFRNRVKYIRKTFHYNNIEFISIVLDDEHFPMPNFKKDTMYKGMKLGKEYSLKELGL